MDGFSYKTLRDHALSVGDGVVTRVSRLNPPSNKGWRIEVTPNADAAVVISLTETTDCQLQGAICTNDSRMLSQALTLTVPHAN